MSVPGFEHHKSRDYETAEKMYRVFLKENPDNTQALHLLGLLLHQTGRSVSAVPLLKQAADQNPDSTQSIALLAMTLSSANKDEEGLSYCQKGLALEPKNANILNAAGRLHFKLADYRHSARLFQKAAQIRPDLTDAQQHLGISLLKLGQHEQAAKQLQAAANITPRNPYIHYHLGCAMQHLGELEHAREAVRTALTLKPDSLEAQCKLVELNLCLCDWTTLHKDIETLSTELTRHIANRGTTQVVPGLLNYFPIANRIHQSLAGYYADQIAQSVEDQELATDPNPQGDMIRLGYVSTDFGATPLGSMLYKLFRLHDRDKFEVFCYSERPFDDELASEVKASADVFRDVSQDSYLDAARQIANDKIDILINLSGYSEFSKPQLFAMRPAPIQMSYLGYPNSLCADFIDYLIADSTAVPKESDGLYSEKIIRLPGSFAVTSDLATPSRTPSREELGLPEDAFVYANFDETKKLEPEVFRAWMWVLTQVPNSIFWTCVENNSTRSKLLKSAEQLEVSENRILFAPSLPPGQHIARLRQADLMLDTLVYGARSAAVAALTAGVPVVTLPGETMRNRLAASFNNALGLNRLNCKNIEAYIQMCVYLGRNPDKLEPMKKHLRDSWMSNPFFDTSQFARRLETAFETVIERRREKLDAVSFDVPEPDVF